MSMNYVRRFTYLISPGEAEYILQKFKADGLQQAPKSADMQMLEIYQKDDNCFLLLDVSESLAHHEIQQTLFHSLDGTNPLERIYEMEQNTIYAPEEGQLKKIIEPKKRFVWTLLLQDDEALIQEYKEVHSMGRAWPEITQNMKTVGVKDMEIYLFGTRAILIMDSEPDFSMETVGPKWQGLPREEEWQEYISKFQRTDPDSSIQEKWQDMEPYLPKNQKLL